MLASTNQNHHLTGSASPHCSYFHLLSPISTSNHLPPEGDSQCSTVSVDQSRPPSMVSARGPDCTLIDVCNTLYWLKASRKIIVDFPIGSLFKKAKQVATHHLGLWDISWSSVMSMPSTTIYDDLRRQKLSRLRELKLTGLIYYMQEPLSSAYTKLTLGFTD